MAQEAATMATDLSPSPLPALPGELWAVVFESVDDQDLLALRQVSRLFEGACFQRFGRAFFGQRAYPLSRSGLPRLIAISQDAVFSPFIETVLIEMGGSNLPANYHDQIDVAFNKLAVRGKPVTIGIRRTMDASKDVGKINPNPHGTSKKMRNILENRVLPAAQSAGLTVKAITFDFDSTDSYYYISKNVYLHVLHWLTSNFNGSGTTSTNFYNASDLAIRFYNPTNPVEITKSVFLHRADRHFEIVGLIVEDCWTLMNWYYALSMTGSVRLTVKNCTMRAPDLYRLCEAVDHLELDNVHVDPVPYWLNIHGFQYPVVWTALLPFIHAQRPLARLRMQNLWHYPVQTPYWQPPQLWLGDGDEVFDISGADKISWGLARLAMGLRGSSDSDDEQEQEEEEKDDD